MKFDIVHSMQISESCQVILYVLNQSMHKALTDLAMYTCWATQF